MAKYKMSDWADYVRGLLSHDEATAMRNHLATAATSEERRLVGSLERLAAAAQQENRLEPPAYAVRSVEALFRQRSPHRESIVERLRLDLVFDSMMAPAAAGSRSLHDTSRQLLFQSDEYALDVRVAYPGDRQGSVVVGQLLERAGTPLDHVPAHLVRDGEIAATAFTSEFGSFCIESGVTPPAELRLLVEEGREIVVDLDPASESE